MQKMLSTPGCVYDTYGPLPTSERNQFFIIVTELTMMFCFRKVS